MGEQFRRLVDEEMAFERPPPLGNLIETAVADGRRIRRTRAICTGALAAILAVVLGGGVAIGAQAVRRSGQPAHPPSPTTAALATATPAALLELLTQLLPGETFGGAGNSDGELVRALIGLDTGQKWGMVGVRISREPGPTPTQCKGSPPPTSGMPSMSGAPTTSTLPPTPSAPTTPGAPTRPSALPSADASVPALSASPTPGPCTTGPDGSIITSQPARDCEHSQLVEVIRPDAVHIEISSVSCVLSISQATRIASDPRWGWRMPAELVQAGEAHFPNLPTMGLR